MLAKALNILASTANLSSPSNSLQTGFRFGQKKGAGGKRHKGVIGVSLLFYCDKQNMLIII